MICDIFLHASYTEQWKLPSKLTSMWIAATTEVGLSDIAADLQVKIVGTVCRGAGGFLIFLNQINKFCRLVITRGIRMVGGKAILYRERLLQLSQYPFFSGVDISSQPRYFSF